MGKVEPSPDVKRWLEAQLPDMLRRHGAAEAYVFGSWARGAADRYSDIDLIVVTPSDRPFVDRFRDLPDVMRTAPTGLDLLIYTPQEFAVQRRASRFLRHALRGARRLV